MESKDKGNALIYQMKDMNWTVYLGVLPDQPNPLKLATIAEVGIRLFEDAVKVAKSRGYADKDIVVQFIKRSELVNK